MKICLIGNDYVQQFPLKGYGGIETCVESLALALKKAGHDFFVIVPKREDHIEYPFKVIESPEFPTSISGKSSSAFAWSCRKIIKQEKPDVIWSQSNWSADALWETGISIVCTFHDACAKQYGWMKRYPNVKYRFLSQYAYNNWVVEDWERKMSFVCPSGLLDEDYKYYNFAQREPNFLWVAGLRWGWESKGLDFFVELANSFPNEYFVAYGEGNKELETKLAKCNARMQNFNWRGNLARGQEHADAFGKSIAFVMPTRTMDTFPRTVLESMSKGTPVIGFGNGAIPERVGEDGGMIISSVEDFGKILDKRWNYGKVFEYSKRFHIDREIETLLKHS